jgi:hypothetical protein
MLAIVASSRAVALRLAAVPFGWPRRVLAKDMLQVHL